MNLEQRRIGELPHVFEALLGARPLAPRVARLPARADDTGDQGDEDQDGGSDTRAIAAHELRGTVAEGVLARRHRQAGEVPADVFRELIDRRVAPRRLLVQRLEDDVVEIAGETASESLRI